MVGEEHGLVHVQRVQFAAHRRSRLDHLRPVRASRPGDTELGARRHGREVEVALLDLRDLAQRHVPGRLGVSRELAWLLMHVDVGIDDPQRLGCPAGTARLRCRRIAWHPKII
jgi:hypothetical protein